MNQNEKEDLLTHMVAELATLRNRIAVEKGGVSRSGDSDHVDDPEFERAWIDACHIQRSVSKTLLSQTEGEPEWEEEEEESYSAVYE